MVMGCFLAKKKEKGSVHHRWIGPFSIINLIYYDGEIDNVKYR